METALQLLTRDGSLHIRFHPKLTPAQYAELYEVANEPTNKLELEEVVEALAARWDIKVECSEV